MAVCVACAAVLRAVCLRLDDRVERVRLAPATTRAVRTGLAATVLAALVFLLAAGAPHWIGSQYHRFVSTKAPDAGGKTTRQRLTDPSNNGRLANWKVALREFRGSALHGDGAGTYALAWAIRPPRGLRLLPGGERALALRREPVGPRDRGPRADRWSCSARSCAASPRESAAPAAASTPRCSAAPRLGVRGRTRLAVADARGHGARVSPRRARPRPAARSRGPLRAAGRNARRVPSPPWPACGSP